MTFPASADFFSPQADLLPWGTWHMPPSSTRQTHGLYFMLQAGRKRRPGLFECNFFQQVTRNEEKKEHDGKWPPREKSLLILNTLDEGGENLKKRKRKPRYGRKKDRSSRFPGLARSSTVRSHSLKKIWNSRLAMLSQIASC